MLRFVKSFAVSVITIIISFLLSDTPGQEFCISKGRWQGDVTLRGITCLSCPVPGRKAGAPASCTGCWLLSQPPGAALSSSLKTAFLRLRAKVVFSSLREPCSRLRTHGCLENVCGLTEQSPFIRCCINRAGSPSLLVLWEEKCRRCL